MKEFKITSRDGVNLGTYKARNKKAQADAVKNGIAPLDGTVVEVG